MDLQRCSQFPKTTIQMILDRGHFRVGEICDVAHRPAKSEDQDDSQPLSI
jgi:hypothetical protein